MKVLMLALCFTSAAEAIQLRPGTYQCGGCIANVIPVSARTIRVSPGRGCSDFGKIYTFTKNSSIGADAFENTRTTERYGTFTAYMFLESPTNYTFHGNTSHTICVKI